MNKYKRGIEKNKILTFRGLKEQYDGCFLTRK